MQDNRLRNVLNENDEFFFSHNPRAVQRVPHRFPGEQIDGDAQSSTFVIVTRRRGGHLVRRRAGGA